MEPITWKLHLNADSKTVFDLLSTPEGRAKFWAEQATEEGDIIHFSFPNGQTYKSQIVKRIPCEAFHLDYFNTLVKFHLQPCEQGGTDLTLMNENVPEYDFSDMKAGWISVLMNLKSVADFHTDLRNHDPSKTWDQGYVDN